MLNGKSCPWVALCSSSFVLDMLPLHGGYCQCVHSTRVMCFAGSYSGGWKGWFLGHEEKALHQKSVWSQAPQRRGHGTKPVRNSRSVWTMLLVIWSSSRYSCEEQGLDSVILMGLFHLEIPHDLMNLWSWEISYSKYFLETVLTWSYLQTLFLDKVKKIRFSKLDSVKTACAHCASNFFKFDQIYKDLSSFLVSNWPSCHFPPLPFIGITGFWICFSQTAESFRAVELLCSHGFYALV